MSHLIDFPKQLIEVSLPLKAISTQSAREKSNRLRPTGKDGLQQFLDQVSLVTQGDNVDGEAELVTLATIHVVKDLEYDVVIIAAVEKGLIPHEQLSSEEEIAEERRLLYVAVMRTRRAVHLSHTITRTLFGVTGCNPPSPFSEEMGLHLSI
jgi:DNA helicase-2/ATP-dependent DNA helicase PcrA